MSEIYDTIVIGAGPAGSSSAYHLASAGLRVLLLDREEFPRDKVCGDGLTPRTMGYLLAMGITGDDLRRQGGVQTHSYRSYHEGQARTNFLKGRISGHTFAFGLMRRELDALIRSRAILAGASPGRANVQYLEYNRAQQCVTVHSDSGLFQSRTLVIATGARSKLNQPFVKPGGASAPYAAGIRQYFATSLPHKSNSLDFFYFSYLPDGYGWVFPVGEKTYNVGVWSHQPKSCGLKKQFDRFVQDIVNDHLPKSCFPVGRSHGEVIGTGPRLSSCYPTVVLVGDAAHLADMTTGEGISYALQSGMECAAHLISVLNSD